ncbi:uncharacterized protein EDB91DRAFT_1259258 [Suillus paluster]|uniref:uncharacterized protein n=1 Tax=Suillus paluster TaxID=48578 RepID=UPI001B8739A4|nr:uncharacterized protein EDB91DRAFT_1259258 [Suillus paluster]KAG1717799.1 hypothetical protein EDB91DRAFT_1259258 [Suillus paluster]
MTTDEPTSTSSSSWHTIRPWTPHLILSVREITSVSATFILSSSLSPPTTTSEPPPNETDASQNTSEQPPITSDLDTEADPETQADIDIETEALNARGIISDALSAGLSVSVNGSPWQRVLIRLLEPADEAVIIIYGLMPGRQYDIDLGLVQGGQASCIRRQVVTEEAENIENGRLDEGTSTSFLLRSSSSSSSTSSSSLSLSSSTTTQDQTPIHAHPQTPRTRSRSTTPTQEDRLPNLQSTLSTLQSRISDLTSTLKSTRRDSQKADAALKSEIEALNRASEKASAAESKARQRIRALEDAVRRASEGKDDVERTRNELEGEVPSLRKQVREKEVECEALRKEASKARREREAKEEERRKRVEGVKTEIGSADHRLERLCARQEKLEGTVLIDLEKTLMEIEKEIQEVEAQVDVGYPQPIGRPLQMQPISPQYRRHQPRSSAYRIGDGAPPGLGLPNPYASSHASSSVYSHSPSSSLSHPKVSILSHSTSSIPSHSTSSVPSHAGGGMLPTSSAASTSGTSTLSSKALPFEPARGFRSSFPPLKPPPGIAPIQRPVGAFSRGS